MILGSVCSCLILFILHSALTALDGRAANSLAAPLALFRLGVRSAPLLVEDEREIQPVINAREVMKEKEGGKGNTRKALPYTWESTLSRQAQA